MQDQLPPAASFCSQCGTALASGAQFCSRCGKATSNSALPYNAQPVVSSPASAQAAKSKSKRGLIGCGCVFAFFLLVFAPVCNMATQTQQAEERQAEVNRQIKETEAKIEERVKQDNPPVSEMGVPKLEVQSWNWSRQTESYIQIVGEVKNISRASLDRVTAVATFYDKKGDVITTEETLIDYQPILSGQTSPFQVITTYNPAMGKAGLAFKELTGGTIMFKYKSKK